MINPLDHNVRVQHRLPLGVADQPLDAPVHALDELEHRLLVQPPLRRQRRGGRKLAAAQLERNLKTVGVHVVEVLHASVHLIPEGAVGDALVELVARTRVSLAHCLVAERVGEG